MKLKRIILEGNECSGKSSLAKKLSEKLGWEIVKGSNFESATGTNEELYDFLEKPLDMDNVIIDRTFFSNMVYATLYPKYTIITNEQYSELQDRLLEQDKNNESIVLYLYTDIETLKERLIDRGDEYIREDKLKDINDMYELLWENAKVEPYGIDTSIFSSDDAVDLVMNLLIK